MNDLTIINHGGTLVTDSREVAEWVGKDHKHLLADIRGYVAALEKSTEPKFRPSAFFLESTYQDSTGRTLPCFLITRKGCDMVANKLTGEKGVRFTATYIDRFYEMEALLNNPGPKIMSPAELSLLQAQALVDIERKQKEQQAAIDTVSTRLDKIGDIIALNPNDWRRESSAMITRIAKALGGNEFIRTVREEIYQIMLDRFGISVKTRVTNKRRKALEEGMPKSRADKISGVDAIADDKKAIEAYLSIIKEMAIKYGLDKSA